jgi:predicted transcriptional regulator
MTKYNKFSKTPSVIFSFKHRWYDPIINGDVGVFFRKRGPNKTPSHVLVYLGAPVSSIISISEVQKITHVDLSTALELAELGCISEDELKNYVGETGLVSAIFIKNHIKFDKALSISDLRKILNFHPPQNFIQIDNDIRILIEEAGNAKKID